MDQFVGVMHEANGKSYRALLSRSLQMRAISKLIENIADTDLDGVDPGRERGRQGTRRSRHSNAGIAVLLDKPTLTETSGRSTTAPECDAPLAADSYLNRYVIRPRVRS